MEEDTDWKSYIQLQVLAGDIFYLENGPLTSSLCCFALMLSLFPVAVTTILSQSTTSFSILSGKGPPHTQWAQVLEDAHPGTKYSLPFSGPDSSVQGSWSERGCSTLTATEISWLKIALCSEKAFNEHI